jgi:hypothetical protein
MGYGNVAPAPFKVVCAVKGRAVRAHNKIRMSLRIVRFLLRINRIGIGYGYVRFNGAVLQDGYTRVNFL